MDVEPHGLEHRIVFLATTGCRRGEALGLRWRDLDLDGGRATIRQTVGTIGGMINEAMRLGVTSAADW